MNLASGSDRSGDALLGPLHARSAGSGRPVVLLHGFPADGRVYDAQLEAARAGRLACSLLAVDLPGFGGTPPPDPPRDVIDVASLVDALADLVDSLDLTRPIVGGVALGGYVAIEFAAARPERVGGLILLGVKPEPDAPANAPRREAVARLALDEGSDAVAKELGDEPFAAAATLDMRTRIREMIAAADASAIAGLARGLHRRPDPKPSLARIRAAELPALVLVGADDPFTKVAAARQLADLLPNSTFEVIEEAGHILPLERPDAVTGALARFLGTHPRDVMREPRDV
jgi:pimeloyl-ACP methyl ester carboxylesterase